MVTRPFVGTINIPETPLAYVRMGYDAPLSHSSPIVQWIYVAGSITVPQSCRLAPGQNLTIDFGSRISDRIALRGQTGIEPVKRRFDIQCNNITSGVKVDLVLDAQPQAKDKRYIATTHKDIGIAVESQGRLIAPTSPGTPPRPEQKLPITMDYKAQSAQFDMSAYPVRMINKPSAGEYQGSATVKFEFQ
ncbi:putative minor fimbrial subunit LpfD [Burkholderia territorii]|nr:putative minor fimbrial subunit LpfD [Burkholderia territorii]